VAGGCPRRAGGRAGGRRGCSRRPRPGPALQGQADQARSKNGYGPGGEIDLADVVRVEQLDQFGLELRELCRLSLVVYKDAGSNTVSVTKELERVVEQLRTEFPGITLNVVAEQADFVVDALSNLGQEIVLGGAPRCW
jgi:multidrug efflux pump subunit AcrB